jgi:hypothetical protein
MITYYLWAMGALIFIALGSIHLAYTFFTNKFSSRNQNVIAQMAASPLVLTKKTTMWKAWVGFNASHSIGVLFSGLINLYIVFNYFDVFQLDHIYLLFNIIVAGFYVWLGKKYWFNVPFLGALITLICYVLSYITIVVH